MYIMIGTVPRERKDTSSLFASYCKKYDGFCVYAINDSAISNMKPHMAIIVAIVAILL